MLYQPEATESLFAAGRPPKVDLPAILDAVRGTLRLPDHVQWKLLSGQRKMGKTLFELEEASDGATRRLIGKIAKKDRADVLFDALRSLRALGWEPPNRFTVVEGVHYIPEHQCLLQERAPGAPALDHFLKSSPQRFEAAEQCAQWLARLQATEIEAPRCPRESKFAQRAEELSEVLPEHRALLTELSAAMQAEDLQAPSPMVPSHGDFHAMNIFTDAETGRVTGIDMDKFCMAERDWDPAYFLAQTACLGYREHETFEGTREVRQHFLSAFEAESGAPIRVSRAAYCIADTLIKNLHFELVLLDTDHTQYAQPFLFAAERALLHGDLHLTR